MQTFKLKIDAQSPDGVAINCHIESSIHCNKDMAISIMANMMRKEPEIKEIISTAVMLCMSGEEITQEISSDEYLDSIIKSKENSDPEL